MNWHLPLAATHGSARWAWGRPHTRPPWRTATAGQSANCRGVGGGGRPPAAAEGALAVSAPQPLPLEHADDEQVAAATAAAGKGVIHAGLYAESPMPPPPTPADAAYRAVDCVRTGLAGTPRDHLWGASRPAVGGGDGAPAYRRPPSVVSAVSEAATCFSCGTEKHFRGVPREDLTESEEDASNLDDAKASAMRVGDMGAIAERPAPLRSNGSDPDVSGASVTTSEAGGDEPDAASACIDATGAEEEDMDASEEAQETDEEDGEAVPLRRLAKIRARKLVSAGFDASTDISLLIAPPGTPTRPYSGPLSAPALASWASSPQPPRHPVADVSMPSTVTAAEMCAAWQTAATSTPTRQQPRRSAAAAWRPTSMAAATPTCKVSAGGAIEARRRPS